MNSILGPGAAPLPTAHCVTTMSEASPSVPGGRITAVVRDYSQTPLGRWRERWGQVNGEFADKQLRSWREGVEASSLLLHLGRGVTLRLSREETEMDLPAQASDFQLPLVCPSGCQTQSEVPPLAVC